MICFAFFMQQGSDPQYQENWFRRMLVLNDIRTRVFKITQPLKVRSGGNSRSRHGPFSKFNGLKEHFLKSDSKTMQTKKMDDISHYESYENGFFGQMPPPPAYPDKKRRL